MPVQQSPETNSHEPLTLPASFEDGTAAHVAAIQSDGARICSDPGSWSHKASFEPDGEAVDDQSRKPLEPLMTTFKRSAAPSPQSDIADDGASSPLESVVPESSTPPASYLLDTYLETPHPHERRSLGLAGRLDVGPSISTTDDFTSAEPQASLVAPQAPRIPQPPVFGDEPGQLFVMAPLIAPIDSPPQQLPLSPGSISLTPDSSTDESALQPVYDQLRQSLTDAGIDCETMKISELMTAYRRSRYSRPAPQVLSKPSR